MSRQQAVIRNAQHQVLGSKAVPTLNPSGKFSAPSVRSQSPIIIKGGSVHYQLQIRGNLLTAVAGAASQMLVEPLSDVISDNIIFPLMEKALGRELPGSAELRQRMEQERQNPKQVRNVKDADKDLLSQTSPEASVMPLNPIDDVDDLPIKDLSPLEEIVEELKESHSPSPQHDERNREYLIRRAALGDNPTQAEMDAVVAYGLEQHRINFPHLYK